MTRLIGFLASALTLAGCLTTGGGGGGDCRDGDEACSPGFACVAVANGTAYACRAACDDAADCLRDEVCGADGVCVDRPARTPDEDAETLEIPDPADMEVEVPPIRFIDAGPDAAPPEDADIVVIVPPDMGPDPGSCVEPATPAADLVLVTELRGFEGFPIHFAAHASAEGESVALTLEPLTSRGRMPTGRQTQTAPFAVDDGAFETDVIELVVPQSANQLGGQLTLEVRFVGAVRGDGSLCGVLEGALVDPPIGDISGSSFAARPTADLGADPWPACAGCLP